MFGAPLPPPPPLPSRAKPSQAEPSRAEPTEHLENNFFASFRLSHTAHQKGVKPKFPQCESPSSHFWLISLTASPFRPYFFSTARQREMAPAHEERLVETTETINARLDREFFSPGFDPRFPNMNQAKRCWVNYVDYHRCLKQKGEDYEPCQYFKKVYQAICPNAWTSKFDEQREAGIFPYDFDKDLKAKQHADGGHVDKAHH
ncbi:putative Cytochrome c oxidase subunit 6B [Hypsibius exemplaris]|uniref:Cytochrome c oxidase subunit 6B1 n=1 Tax=Hypsibius exemplaris TaxID=2072580 RepID=A0A1W0WE89_HYPEX|nr:putative Cytochrome c oxidase subunit 6B [Hypsibius exemplaris]